MNIHVVQAGETIESIAENYNVSAERLILENGIFNPNQLVIGQTIVILSPSLTYTVQAGDTLGSIADVFNVSVMHLLRNNAYLSDREVLIPGETIVINYETNKTRTIKTSGYAYPFITEDNLRKTLPFLTYIHILNYRITEEVEIEDVDDSDIINLAKEYGVAPILFLSTLSSQGVGNYNTINNILNDTTLQAQLIDKIIKLLTTKGFFGINIYLQYFNNDNRLLYEDFIKALSEQLKSKGFLLILTFTPRLSIERTEISYTNVDYSAVADSADSVILLSYDWSYSYGPPEAATPINIINLILDNITQIISPEELLLGIQVIGYDWELPYIPAYTLARSLTFDLAIGLALDTGAVIQYNEISQDPYFFYINESGSLHIVWFQDARSIYAMTTLINDYRLQGLSIWNLMYFFNQMWLVINNEFEIEKEVL